MQLQSQPHSLTTKDFRDASFFSFAFRRGLRLDIFFFVCRHCANRHISRFAIAKSSCAHKFYRSIADTDAIVTGDFEYQRASCRIESRADYSKWRRAGSFAWRFGKPRREVELQRDIARHHSRAGRQARVAGHQFARRDCRQFDRAAFRRAASVGRQHICAAAFSGRTVRFQRAVDIEYSNGRDWRERWRRAFGQSSRGFGESRKPGRSN